ncbi:DNA-binding transcriptional regulator, CsgD family [Rhodococcus rhodochrous J3]|uniref:Helix-turn-helix transcriptional regulator n=2 Tax=Rhodococcus rhodochrous TaxID=1829 RepID=A0AA47A9Z9_RHORH|nr:MULTISPECIES: helix-turn-helix transcriptional regulator [Rhodococcus]AYA24461.1 helix-turn-helix transcriptional regulator [Rhodococcus rhodochrous]MBF4480436.1 helix-turn-helix transcriptional regulator [Rhodococcus rhodochrous]MCB8911562.1 helix-turn-helix transcriptional regulator [Rhodococcus rhodochrous]MCD2099714.1 helix-turn-helix transcriptional regulator [Rhodococcus rhodochrous]MCD2124154.1 helix-turn-helix transcriptional regulator [Rhodococcus rhodochrous]
MNAQHRSPSFHEMRVGGLVRPLLSAREKEVLLTWLAADSKTEAARRLFISVGTLNTHLQRIRLKYAAAGRDASTKASLLARALQDGLTTLDEW